MSSKSEYRLETLLKIRERTKEEAEIFLAKCMAELEKEKQLLSKMESELKDMILKREEKKREYTEKTLRGEMDARTAIAANTFVEHLKKTEEIQKETIESQKNVIIERERDVSEARGKLLEETKNYKALEKHREKWKENVAKIKAKKQEEVQDETAQIIFSRKE